MEALSVIKDEGLVERADRLGKVFRGKLEEGIGHMSWVKQIRGEEGLRRVQFHGVRLGKGLLNAVVCDDTFRDKVKAWDVGWSALLLSLLSYLGLSGPPRCWSPRQANP